MCFWSLLLKGSWWLYFTLSKSSVTRMHHYSSSQTYNTRPYQPISEIYGDTYQRDRSINLSKYTLYWVSRLWLPALTVSRTAFYPKTHNETPPIPKHDECCKSLVQSFYSGWSMYCSKQLSLVNNLIWPLQLKLDISQFHF